MAVNIFSEMTGGPGSMAVENAGLGFRGSTGLHFWIVAIRTVRLGLILGTCTEVTVTQ
jgi:hypothetical protein